MILTLFKNTPTCEVIARLHRLSFREVYRLSKRLNRIIRNCEGYDWNNNKNHSHFVCYLTTDEFRNFYNEVTSILEVEFRRRKLRLLAA